MEPTKGSSDQDAHSLAMRELELEQKQLELERMRLEMQRGTSSGYSGSTPAAVGTPAYGSPPTPGTTPPYGYGSQAYGAPPPHLGHAYSSPNPHQYPPQQPYSHSHTMPHAYSAPAVVVQQQQQQQQQQGKTAVEQSYCGPASWIIGIFLLPCICCCPIDKRMVYV